MGGSVANIVRFGGGGGGASSRSVTSAKGRRKVSRVSEGGSLGAPTAIDDNITIAARMSFCVPCMHKVTTELIRLVTNGAWCGSPLTEHQRTNRSEFSNGAYRLHGESKTLEWVSSLCLLSRGRVPKFDGPVARGSGQTPAVGAVGHSIDGVLMADKAAEPGLQLS